jgi:hypothetical protein
MIPSSGYLKVPRISYGLLTCVERGHNGFAGVGMREPQAVPNFVGHSLQQVRPLNVQEKRK